VATRAEILEESDEQLAEPIPREPSGNGTVGAVLGRSAGHSIRHLDWLRAVGAGSAQPGASGNTA
jgi:hypothetical protein